MKHQSAATAWIVRAYVPNRYLAAYAVLLLVITVLLVCYDVFTSDAGEVAQGGVGFFLGPRQKRLILAMTLLSWTSSFLFVLELYLGGRVPLAATATVLCLVSVAGSASYHAWHVREYYFLDAEEHAKAWEVYTFVELLVPFDLELLPLRACRAA